MSSVYERELKGILSAEEGVLDKMTRACPPEQAAAFRKAKAKPFLVVRGAGSLGVDLVALRGDVSFPIEVKSAASDTIRFSDDSGRNHARVGGGHLEDVIPGAVALYETEHTGVAS